MNNPIVKRFFLDPFERAAMQFIFVLVPFLTLTTGVTLGQQPWGAALDAAGFSALFTYVAAVLLNLAGFTWSGWLDIMRRVVLGFASSFVAILTAPDVNHTLSHADWKGALVVSLGAALAILLKALGLSGNPTTVGGSALVTR